MIPTTDYSFLPIRTSAITILRGHVVLQKKKKSTYLLLLKSRSGYHYCYFSENPYIRDGQTVSVVGNPFSSNLGTILNLFQCHVIPYREHQGIVKSILSLLPVEIIKRNIQ
jgi:hypothetical protein